MTRMMLVLMLSIVLAPDSISMHIVLSASVPQSVKSEEGQQLGLLEDADSRLSAIIDRIMLEDDGQLSGNEEKLSNSLESLRDRESMNKFRPKSETNDDVMRKYLAKTTRGMDHRLIQSIMDKVSVEGGHGEKGREEFDNMDRGQAGARRVMSAGSKYRLNWSPPADVLTGKRWKRAGVCCSMDMYCFFCGR
jgi:hypothetical protein